MAEIGGKAKGLGAILAASAPCPPSFTVTTSALRHCFGSLLEVTRGGALPDDFAAELDARVRTLPQDADGRYSLAIRSSFTTEDRPDAVSPGVYHSEVGPVTLDEVGPAVMRVWASGFTPGAIAYRAVKGLPTEELGMAVVIQHAPRPAVGGVVYTLVPGTNDASAILLEYANGSPSNVVEHQRSVQSRIISKRTRAAVEIPFDAEALIDWSLKLERAHNAPLDIEWLIDADGRLWLVQARRLPYCREPEIGYTSDARGTTLRSGKLAPFRLSADAPINVAPAALVLPGAFAEYKSSGIGPELVKALRAVFAPFLDHGPVSMRSAYWSALDGGDMMPQSGRLTTLDECVDHVVDFWRFIIDSGRDDYTAEIALLILNWTSLRASLIALVPDEGPATIAALYGQLGGLESFAHDVYDIDLRTLTAIRSVVPEKPQMFVLPGEPPTEVPTELRQARVLDDVEIEHVGHDLAAIRKVFGGARVEFLVLNDGAIITWQVSALTPVETTLHYFQVTREVEAGAKISGPLIPIHRAEDMAALRDAPGDRIAYVDFLGSGLRDPAAAVAIVSELKSANCPVLLRGSLLSHFAALLRDYGVTVYPILQELDDIPAGSVVEVRPLA
ncbi:PEP/pyruvate-binding domain-containing protein [Acrocarpospora corrugata]|uniref:PEP/pyruvate-binding domain-containing protein n=1 Tax=Acrocarpospora corrugata TaxID=35763 RepID=UPI00147928E8|nr:PEP/pyruvate-binding domain-containing protein [Acrocarpospora corrugata]